MQGSYSQTDWQENHVDETLRRALSDASSPTLVRQLFPLRARLVRADKTYRLPAGTTFTYARTKMVPSLYPIEVCTFKESGLGTAVRCIHYNSTEVELMRAEA